MPIYSERHYRSRDGLQLYYRDYPGDARRTPVLCLHGLTRNCRDFAALALRIAPGRREKHDLECVRVPNRGHAPQLDERQSMAALERFLAELE